ncbi:EI24 domain-containing protein tank isoform X2 [Lycorma delicatula]|uniref:EI24 domain-containing protein tank isoform X2 n=1 Tax=Lycorma delicatula TaxID=130591 RepID=UPI003F511614
MDIFVSVLKAMFKGLADSLKGTVTIFYLDKNIMDRASQSSPIRDQNASPRRRNSQLTPAKPIQRHLEEPKVLRRTAQCCALNGGVFWLSILLFEYAVLPGLKYFMISAFGNSSVTGKYVWTVTKSCLTWTFGMIWVLPLFLLSKVINSLWFQDIADSAYRYSRGRPQQLSSVSKLIADSLFSILVQALFLVQSMMVNLVPYQLLGEVLFLVHMCMLYSLYAFEYKWCNMGWELHRRLTYIENNWPYFIGFGLPLAVFTAIPSSYIISGCVFSILFPLFIISGNEADPVINVCDINLKLFSPVIAISNAVFNRTIGPRVSQSHQVNRR